MFEPNQFTNGVTASGAPTYFSISVVAMTLQGQDGTKQVSVPIFSDPNGKAIVINGGTVDLSKMFTQFECVDNNGTSTCCSPTKHVDVASMPITSSFRPSPSKGNNQNMGGWDASYVAVNQDGTYNLTYNLGTTGTLFN